jgi:iron complex outermembrane recepter protein
MKLLQILLTGFICILTSTSALGQQPGYVGEAQGGTIVGLVKDKASGEAIEFAAASVLRTGDSVLVGGTITDMDGKFRVSDLAPGDYILKVDFLGYMPQFMDFTISAANPFFRAGLIELEVEANLLDGVEITAERSYFQQSIDKKVYNIEKDIVASAGTASEALQNIPSITVDLDGNVSLRGNSNVRIFIDGKPSGLMGSSMVAILEQIPANTIESIEVVTNPSARYEAEGGGGIINIVLKKNKILGLNGVATVGGSTFPGYDGSLNLNYRGKKWNLFSTYSYDNRERDGFSTVYRKITYPLEDSISWYTSEGNSTQGGFNHNFRGGADYTINSKSTVGVYGFFGTGENRNEDYNSYLFLNNDSLINNANYRTGLANSESYSYNAGMNYRKTFSSVKHTLTADAFFSRGYGDGLTNFEERSYDGSGAEIAFPIFQHITTIDNQQDVNVQADYVQPFENGDQLEAGLRFTQEFRDNDLFSESFDETEGVFLNDDSISNRFRFDQKIVAAYLIWNSGFKKLGYQLGLRAEQTYMNSELVTTGEDFQNNYFRLFPSAHLSYKLSDASEIFTSYSRRINRPRMWFLNPFPDYSDPYTYRQGNPFLLPENENSFELGMNNSWEKHTLSSSVYYKYTTNEFSAYTVVDSNGYSRTSFENFASEEEYGFEFVVRNQFTKWWSATSSLNVNRTNLNGENIEQGLANALTNYNARMMMFFKITEQTSLQLTYSYWRPWVMAQGIPQPFTYLDAGIRSDFFNNKLSVNLTFSDIFDTRDFETTGEGLNFYQEFRRKRETRAAAIRLTYKFGSQDSRNKQRGNGNYDGGGGMEMF